MGLDGRGTGCGGKQSYLDGECVEAAARPRLPFRFLFGREQSDKAYGDMVGMELREVAVSKDS